ncbi:MAG: hypothetical protein AB8B69_12325 [Chitinophagales bacterium]
MKTSSFVYGFLLFLPLFLFPPSSTASVGGPQTLEMLGYDVSQNSVLLLRHKKDAEGLPPQLWAFRLASGETEVLSDASKYFQNDQSITTGLKSLKKTQVVTPKMLQTSWQTPIEGNDTIRQFEYTLYPAKVKLLDHQFDILQCYTKDKPIEVAEQYYFEQSDLVFSIFQHFGVCFETGYTKDTLLVSTMSAIESMAYDLKEMEKDTSSMNNNQTVTPPSKKVPAPSDDYSLAYTLSAMIILAMVYLFLRSKSGRNRRKKRRR